MASNIGESGLFSYGVTANLGVQTSSSSTTQTSTQGNSISSGKLVMHIDQDIRFSGIRANLEELELKAQNLYVEASSSTVSSEQVSGDFNVKIPLGSSYGGGTQLGFGMSNRSGNSAEVSYDENYITVKGKLKLDIAGKGVIRGVSIEAGEIEGSFGSLVVETLRDVVRERMHGFSLKIGGGGNALGAQKDLYNRCSR